MEGERFQNDSWRVFSRDTGSTPYIEEARKREEDLEMDRISVASSSAISTPRMHPTGKGSISIVCIQ